MRNFAVLSLFAMHDQGEYEPKNGSPQRMGIVDTTPRGEVLRTPGITNRYANPRGSEYLTPGRVPPPFAESPKWETVHNSPHHLPSFAGTAHFAHLFQEC